MRLSDLPDLRTAATAPIFAASSNHIEIGRFQGRQFAALLPRGGAGMLETKPPNIEVKILKAHWAEESASKAVRFWLKMAISRSGSISLVGAQDDSMAGSSQSSSAEYQRSRTVATATIYIPPLTGQAMEMIAKATQDGTQPPEHAFTTSFSIPAFESLVPRTA